MKKTIKYAVKVFVNICVFYTFWVILMGMLATATEGYFSLLHEKIFLIIGTFFASILITLKIRLKFEMEREYGKKD